MNNARIYTERILLTMPKVRGVPRRIILGSATYHPVQGGVENSLYHLAVEYRRLGYIPWIVTSSIGVSAHGRKSYVIGRQDGIPVIRYKASPFILVRLLRAWRALGILYRGRTFQIVISRDYLISLAAYLRRKKCVYLVPGLVEKERTAAATNPFRYLERHLAICLQRWSLRVTSAVAVFSSQTASQIYRTGITEGIHIVKPGLDTDRFKPADDICRIRRRRVLGIPEDAKVAIVVGRLISVKRIDLAIRAVAAGPHDWHLVIVGDGPLRASLVGLASELSIASRVWFTGSTNCPEQYYQLADILVLPSELETFGQVLIEGLSCGLVVVAFDPDLPGVETATKEIVPPDLLFAAKTKDAHGLREAMAKAFECTIDRMRVAQAVRGEYSWKKLANDLVLIGERT